MKAATEKVARSRATVKSAQGKPAKPSREKPTEPEKAEPRVGVFICHCGANIAGFLDVEEVAEYAETLPNVKYVKRNLYTCAEDGIASIKEAISKHNLNRVVVAACTPRTHEPLFRKACEDAGLNKYLFEFANIRDQCSWVHMHDWERATEKAKDLVRMSVMRVSHLEGLEDISVEINPVSCIIGAGISGMTAALSIAEQGYDVHLLEKESQPGGMLNSLYNLTPTGADPKRLIKGYIERINSNPKVHLYTDVLIKSVKGFFGNFEVEITSKQGDFSIKCGTIIVASGSSELKPEGLYGYGKLKDVITQGELEKMLLDDRLPALHDVVMIQCAGSRGMLVSYCSRICCMVAIKNALNIKEKFPDARVSILHNDIEVYGVIQEEWYRKARAAGIRFRKFDPEKIPEVAEKDGRLEVRTYLDLLQREASYPADLVVLSTPLIQTEDGLSLSKYLRVPIGQDKFFFEAHTKLRPVDFATDGIYVCGTAQGPKDVAESVAQAHAAASHAVNPMRQGIVRTEAITSRVDEDSCIGCGFCEWVCPFGAVKMVINEQMRLVSSINPALCKGCGACAAGCPTLAIKTQHFTEDQTLAQIKAAFPEPTKPGKGFEPQILAFTCNWCSYAGADYAGVSRMQYPPNVRIIRLMCSARIDPLYVLEAFRHNADGVLMSGCHIGDCHYISANLMTEKRYNALKEYIEALGIEPERLELAWISASEGEKFASTIKNMVDAIKKLGPINKSLLRYKAPERMRDPETCSKENAIKA
ncbi:MAG: hydrogenase iron-sulfur subunit [Actinomycetota bacterium]|nr:hydrogenase iron-sulfur subunit [Actinomycetota bacterium]